MGKDSGTLRGLAANLGDVKMKAGMMWRWATGDVGSMEEMQRGDGETILSKWQLTLSHNATTT